jgi:hypothetical protein
MKTKKQVSKEPQERGEECVKNRKSINHDAILASGFPYFLFLVSSLCVAMSRDSISVFCVPSAQLCFKETNVGAWIVYFCLARLQQVLLFPL